MKQTITQILAVCIIIIVFFEIFGGWKMSSNLYWGVFGLDGNNTAYDYLSAPVEKVVHFKMQMCDDGVCLDNRDWRCGFTIDSSRFDSDEFSDWYEAVQDCFDKVVRVVPVYMRLDKLRKICGRHYMQFDPPAGVTADGCQAVGGDWGVRSPLWTDENELLAKAGISLN